MWVIKLGGSLVHSGRLRPWLDMLATHGGGRTVIVPGGGPFADQVRQIYRDWCLPDSVAHHMALLSMAQYGLMMQGLSAQLVPLDNVTAIHNAVQSKRVPVWLPAPMVLGHSETIEASWNVTSDSLSLWLADHLEASRLLLVKSVPAPRTGTSLRDLVDAGALDSAFEDFAMRSKCPIFCLGPDDYQSLERALVLDDYVGTRVMACEQ